MSGPDLFTPPRRVRRGAALTLVFTSVLVTGAAAGSWSRATGEDPHPVPVAAGGPAAPDGTAREAVDAAAAALVDGKSPVEAARRAVSRSGDRWGAVYSEAEYAEFARALDGEYTGVGLWARRVGGGLIEVTRVRDGGPAERAGVRERDLIRGVDGVPVDGRPVTEVIGLLRGRGPAAPGTEVRLDLQRGDRRWTAGLRRAVLTTEPVTVERLGTPAAPRVLIKVAAFTQGSGAQVRSAVREAPSGAGILLDLRGNSGGLVSEAAEAASAFLDGGLVATYDVRGEEHAVHAAPGGDVRRPVVALVDGGTMSAAELLTGALKDRGRAVVVGSRTFGKGSVQLPSPLPDGSVAELTVGHYRTPSGRGVDGRGITPDLEATDTGPAAPADPPAPPSAPATQGAAPGPPEAPGDGGAEGAGDAVDLPDPVERRAESVLNGLGSRR
ncbi:S41 family peptidase [Streptomyces sp. NPDC049906]|uniref:S41 family peptidase n=1 Tax=Streptomyces sp. NPDC049906 TaxID=3155656 RepID=UPI00341D2C36